MNYNVFEGTSTFTPLDGLAVAAVTSAPCQLQRVRGNAERSATWRTVYNYVLAASVAGSALKRRWQRHQKAYRRQYARALIVILNAKWTKDMLNVPRVLTLMTTRSQKSWSCGMGSKCCTPVNWLWGVGPSSSWLLSFGSDLQHRTREVTHWSSWQSLS
jgi:hypothetical protein